MTNAPTVWVITSMTNDDPTTPYVTVWASRERAMAALMATDEGTLPWEGHTDDLFGIVGDYACWNEHESVTLTQMPVG